MAVSARLKHPRQAKNPFVSQLEPVQALIIARTDTTLALILGLPKQARNALDILVHYYDFDKGVSVVSVADLRKWTGYHNVQCSAAIGQLVDVGLIARSTKQNHYYLSPKVAIPLTGLLGR